MTTVPSSAARQGRQALGARLREIRKDAGLSGRELAAATGRHFTRVSKIEHGVQVPADSDIRDWCRACGADDQVPDLIATARAVESAYLEFRRQSRAGMKRVLGAHTLPLYETTSRFRIYEHNVIPGLFQTAAYCAAMLSFWIGFLDAPDDLEAAVAARMERQKVIYDPGKRFTVVLEEPALRTWFGTAEVQAGQLGRLLEVMSVPTVSLGIIPLKTERSGVPAAGFWIFDDARAALEIPTASIEVTRPDEVGLYARMFGHLEAAAVRGAGARRLIIRALRELQLPQQLATSWTRRRPRSYDHGMAGEMHVWLWFAGNFCGVSDNRMRAMERAEAHLADGETVLVEHARLVLGVHGPRHLRTGQKYTARLVCGQTRWTEPSARWHRDSATGQRPLGFFPGSRTG